MPLLAGVAAKNRLSQIYKIMNIYTPIEIYRHLLSTLHYVKDRDTPKRNPDHDERDPAHRSPQHHCNFESPCPKQYGCPQEQHLWIKKKNGIIRKG